jgi:hypothetical protein
MKKPRLYRDLPADIVRHRRYGSAPRPSGLRVPEEEIRKSFWRYRGERLFPETAIAADVSKQPLSIGPRFYYVDMLRECRSCHRPFIFFALEQRYWYETLGFVIDADCVLCPDCRRESQALRRRTRRYSDLVRKQDLTPKELQFLVDDAAFLFTKGVLKNTNPLGHLKNRALKMIPDYPGVQALAQLLANAKP